MQPLKHILILLFATVLSVSIRAQDKEQITITDVKAEKGEGLVHVSFNVVVGSKAVKQHYLIQPILEGKDAKQASFSPILIESRKGQIITARNLKKSEQVLPSYSNGDSFTYANSISYEEWMSGSSLKFEYSDSSCCNQQGKFSEVKLKDLFIPEVKVITPTFEPKLSMIEEVVNTTKNVSKSEYTVDFAVGESEIDFGLRNNRQSLSMLGTTIKNIVDSKDKKLSYVEITGYASPDGSKEVNDKLSSKRAGSIKQFMQNNIAGLNDGSFKLVVGGENWEQLRQLVVSSSMSSSDKQAVLSVIDNTTLADGGVKRKKMLKELKDGSLYVQMRSNIFPKLRNTHQVVVAYILERDETCNVINKATELIKTGKHTEALPQLLNIANDERAWNAIGVCYLKDNDIQKANTFFKKAASKGSKDASYNYNMLNK